MPMSLQIIRRVKGWVLRSLKWVVRFLQTLGSRFVTGPDSLAPDTDKGLHKAELLNFGGNARFKGEYEAGCSGRLYLPSASGSGERKRATCRI